MNRLAKVVLITVWLIVATHLYAIVWRFHPDYFPEYPEWVGLSIDRMTRGYQPNGIESLTTYYYLILSFLPVSLMTFLAILGWHLLRRRRTKPR